MPFARLVFCILVVLFSGPVQAKKGRLTSDQKAGVVKKCSAQNKRLIRAPTPPKLSGPSAGGRFQSSARADEVTISPHRSASASELSPA